MCFLIGSSTSPVCLINSFVCPLYLSPQFQFIPCSGLFVVSAKHHVGCVSFSYVFLLGFVFKDSLSSLALPFTTANHDSLYKQQSCVLNQTK